MNEPLHSNDLTVELGTIEFHLTIASRQFVDSCLVYIIIIGVITLCIEYILI